MSWTVLFHDDFAAEFAALAESLQDELLAHALLAQPEVKPIGLGARNSLRLEAGLPLSYLWRRASARQRAVTMFGKLRVWDTEHNNGVLIYLLFAEQAIEIVADRGLARHVPKAQWDTLLVDMRVAFRAGRFEEGLAQAIDAVHALLLQHYPLAEGQVNPNELPDQADLR